MMNQYEEIIVWAQEALERLQRKKLRSRPGGLLPPYMLAAISDWVSDRESEYGKRLWDWAEETGSWKLYCQWELQTAVRAAKRALEAGSPAS